METMSTINKILTMLVPVLVFTDFLIGPRKREQMRDKTAEYWLKLSNVTYLGIAEDEFKKLDDFRSKYFGKTFSIKRLVATIILSITYSYIFISYGLKLVKEQFSRTDPAWLER